ncbi:MAG: xanthine dehydrogenase family protein molybdopterin-binding subunit [Acidimicrobiales bacterium]|nr:carbon monoxide dehydrogenase [Acidimicrobiaceae bacterium]MCS5679950.1 xanthine dehydrogenase family protein molybdopterin-binding subunit [Acidimicrobiales bacterium]MEE3212822.1 xanthine dehydrogenase family protein molybdopterin-binding subunit [Actinomycetota bacterium]
MTVTESPFTGGIVGESRLRHEDAALLTGEAKFIDDLQIPGALWVACVRSPHAHARIGGIDASAALAIDGVVAVYSGDDLADAWAAPLPCAWPVTEDMKNPAHHPVAQGKANYAGDIVAVVVAESRYAAADGLEGVVVDYEPLDAVVTIEDAETDRIVIHESEGTNVSYVWPLVPDPDAVEAAFADAAHHVTETFVHQRLIPTAMEPRGVAAVPAPHNGDMILYSSTQIPHILKVMAAITLGLPEQKVRVIAPSVGGGFGCKLNVYAEEIICMALAQRHGVPVRWTEGRTEAAGSTIHGRAQRQTIELAADADGKLTAVRATLLADMGAYLQLVAPGVPLLGAFLYHGLYDVPVYSFTCKSVFTNLTPTDAYRGAGRPEATYAIERAMDALAVVVGVGPDEIRSRNFIPTEKFPYDSPAGLTFDSGNYQPTLDRAKELVDWDGRRAEQAERRAAGATTHLGLGISSYVEMCGLAPSRTLAALNYGAGGWESATVRILPTCKVQVVTGVTPHGQGHETCWSMIVADQLGIDPDDVEVLHSDTAISPLGMDTYGSRSLAVGGTAIWMATEKVIDKARAIAAHMLEANADDLEFAGGTFSVRGSPDQVVPLAGVAFGAFTAHDLPDGMEPNLQAQVTFDPSNFVFPFGTHIAVVEVDEATGAVELLDYAAVDDCGNQINPLIVEGQLHGGIVQGIAQALWEDAAYDADGQCRAANLADYLVPSAAECIDMKLDYTVTPSPSNPMGVKGIGEAGTIASTPAVMNAVVDALRPMGITDITMPASPMTVRRSIEAAQGGSA